MDSETAYPKTVGYKFVVQLLAFFYVITWEAWKLTDIFRLLDVNGLKHIVNSAYISMIALPQFLTKFRSAFKLS